MHRARILDSASSGYDWLHPKIRFVRVPKCYLNLHGDFEETFRRLAELAAIKAGKSLACDGHFVYMPAHELQLSNISKRFKNVEILQSNIYLPALAQSSIRYGNS